MSSFRRGLTRLLSLRKDVVASGGDLVEQSAGSASGGPTSATTQGGSIAALSVGPRTLRLALSAAALTMLFAAGASSAVAAQPWWHLTSNSRPSYIDPDAGTPGVPGEREIQKISVPLEEIGGHPEQGGFLLVVGEGTAAEELLGVFSTEPFAAEEELTPLDAAHLREALEGPYGAGSVHVTETSASGLLTFTVESPKTDAPINVVEEFSSGPTATIVQQGTPETPEVPDGEIYLTAENVGDADVSGVTSPVTLTDVLPHNLRPVGIAATKPGKEGNFQARELIPCKLATLSCEFKGTLAPYDDLEIKISVDVEPGAQTGEVNELRVAGGGAAASSVSRPIVVSPGPVPFGVDEYEMALEEEGGAAPSQAGRHPFQFTTQITLNQNRDVNPLEAEGAALSVGKPEVTPAGGLAKDFSFKLPPGLVGNAKNLPVCTTAQFFGTIEGRENRCPEDTAVGVATATVHEPATVGTVTVVEPIFNMEPDFGEPARFGFYVVIANTPVFIDTSLRSGGEHPDYGIDAEVHNLTQTGSVLSSTATFWGTPGDARHNAQRGWGCIYEARGAGVTGENQPCTPLEETNPKPFFSMPTQCTEALRAEGELDPWNVGQGIFSPFAGTFAPSGLLTGCNQLPFGPTFGAEPTTTSGSAPTGLNVDLDLKQEGIENPEGLAESAVKRVTVALPQGVTTNPSVANGLSACTLAQYEAEALGNQSCPESSKVGEVEIESPLVRPLVKGSVYVAKQGDNPAHNLLSIYMVAKNPELGVLVKSAGAVTPNQQTGQLTTTFDDLPQLPFDHFHFAFRQGPRAPLITPGLCGTYTTGADIYPYSNPAVPVHRDATFTIAGSCASSEAQMPNKPTLEAGTLTPIAGAYSPFVFEVERPDGSQALSRIEATLPEGLLGRIAGVGQCTDAQIAQAESRGGEGQGQAELDSPSCPANSQVGIVEAGTGAGPQPYYVQGKAYLAGPYKGAPLSLAIITPAVVGPFDLGTVVIRTALYVDETTAQIHAVSDPIPQILHGLPTVIRSVSLQMDRPQFTLNPTSCEAKQIEAAAVSTLGNVAPLSERFQVGACAALAFKPTLKLSLSGQLKRTGNPALKAVLTQPKGQNANIAKTSVVLPKGMFIDNAHINGPCTRVQFNSTALPGEACPRTSVLGTAKVWTPLLERPEEGKVYFRSNGGERELPDLVVALRGQIPVQLVGFIDSVGRKGAEVRRVRTRFQSVPDAPVSRFELKLFGGRRGLLENSQNLCRRLGPSTYKLLAQNGKVYDTEPKVAVHCGGRHKKKDKAHKSRGGRK